MLVAFGGLPGTGKTTIAGEISRRLGATYLRLDTIEEAIRSASVLAGDVGVSGYIVAYRVAAENLRQGRIVVADSVNPVLATRAAWRQVAGEAAADLLEVEVRCSDRREHRRRVETRVADTLGLTLPTWNDVLGRDYEAWSGDQLVLDTAELSPEEAVAIVLHAIRNLSASDLP